MSLVDLGLSLLLYSLGWIIVYADHSETISAKKRWSAVLVILFALITIGGEFGQLRVDILCAIAWPHIAIYLLEKFSSLDTLQNPAKRFVERKLSGIELELENDRANNVLSQEMRDRQQYHRECCIEILTFFESS